MMKSSRKKAITIKRPHITLKFASSLDGRIAMASGESKWITGPEARAEVHRLRGRHDAILTGSGTVLADDPELTCRLPDYSGPQPHRFVVDRRGRIPDGTRLSETQDLSPVTVFTSKAGSRTGARDLVHHVCKSWKSEAFLKEILTNIADRGLSTLMVESGGTLAAGFMAAGLVDEIHWFRAPMIIGGKGRPVLADTGFEKLADTLRLTRKGLHECGNDLYEIYARG